MKCNEIDSRYLKQHFFKGLPQQILLFLRTYVYKYISWKTENNLYK